MKGSPGWSLHSQAALHSVGQPERTILNAVATVLARHDWRVLVPTEDFVAFIAEHDEELATKIEALRAADPPERAELWVARLRGL